MNRSTDPERSQARRVQVRVRRKRTDPGTKRDCGTIQIVRATRIDVENRAFRRRRIADAANARERIVTRELFDRGSRFRFKGICEQRRETDNRCDLRLGLKSNGDA